MPMPDLTTLTTDELTTLTEVELTELLVEPVATVGWFDLLGMGRTGAVPVLIVVVQGHGYVSGGDVGHGYISGGAAGHGYVSGGDVGEISG